MTPATTEEWHRLYSVNTLGIMFCFKYAAQQMIKQGRGGRLISMSVRWPVITIIHRSFIGACSGAGKQGNVNMVAYSASKFAVRGLTQALGKFSPRSVLAAFSHGELFRVSPRASSTQDHSQRLRARSDLHTRRSLTQSFASYLEYQTELGQIDSRSPGR